MVLFHTDLLKKKCLSKSNLVIVHSLFVTFILIYYSRNCIHMLVWPRHEYVLNVETHLRGNLRRLTFCSRA